MPVVQIGKPGANLDTTKRYNVKLAAGIQGEKRLAEKVLDWAQKKENAPILVAFSITSDGKGDIDCIVASGNRLVCIDAKNFSKGYTYGVTKDGKLRRTEGLGVPRGRSFAKTGGTINTRSQMERFKRILDENSLRFKISKPLVVLSPCVKGGVAIYRDDNWKSAPFSLLQLDWLENRLDWIFKEDLRPSPSLEKLAHVLKGHAVQ